MAVKGASVAYCAVGGLVLLSGIKGSTLADTVKAVLSGNLTLTNTEPIDTSVTSGAATGGNSAAVLAFAEQYNGHKYVYGGPSNPTDGWDCSSFVSYVLGQNSLSIPGGSWAAETSSGKEHGPTADAYLTWSGASTVAASAVQPGDLLCWPTHVGFAVSSTQMFSAYDTASGTLQTAWTGPSGEGSPTVRSITQGTATGGSTGSDSTFAAELLSTMNAPNTTANINSLNGWFGREGTAAQNNPLATTQTEPGSTTFNSDGVQNFPTQAVGITATAATLNNGRYPAIVMALQAGQGLDAGNQQVQQELLTWSGGGYDSV